MPNAPNELRGVARGSAREQHNARDKQKSNFVVTVNLGAAVSFTQPRWSRQLFCAYCASSAPPRTTFRVVRGRTAGTRPVVTGEIGRVELPGTIRPVRVTLS
ncbi:hypothetical protein GCM10022419_069770 [Nonomuraea rosea]|uniref:Uncharacterized protein n=1 Tax=Nonomuraea rosea TaxID=638574 RepID=A0ABP6Y6T4_9ACTN